jgi:hypothetical protein
VAQTQRQAHERLLAELDRACAGLDRSHALMNQAQRTLQDAMLCLERARQLRDTLPGLTRSPHRATSDPSRESRPDSN